MNIGFIPAKTARLTPNKEALIDVHSGRRVTFGELDENVRRLSNGLVRGLGLEKGDRVAVISKNSIEYMEIYYACARVGMIVQPVNWRLGLDEILRILEDGSPSVVIFSEEYDQYADHLRSRLGTVHWLKFGCSNSSYSALLNESLSSEPPLSSGIGGDDPVLILYTGGTTGKSKGALHSHHSIYMGMVNQTVAERILPTDVYLLTGQMFHIPIALGMNYHAHGCPMVLINFDARLVLETIQKERVSSFLGITTMLNWMMADEKFSEYDLSSLRNIQYGGGPMPSSVVAAALKAFPCTIIQGYGQTEGMTMSFLTQEDHLRALDGDHPERLESCGREGFVTEISLLDSDGKLVPRDSNTPGEIFVRSEANMIGYWGQLELTNETIRDGWMSTGDIAVWDNDGYIFIVDRAKDMIISGGENIFSTQVEAAIHRHPGVLESAVFGVPDDEWGEAVKAVVVMKPGCVATEREIIDVAAKYLASYQKPKSVDFIESLPKASTGKILKRELRSPYWAGERSVV
jgi:acyl-CoA synthetase (AMP-forming)/AMP-acid ligase II